LEFRVHGPVLFTTAKEIRPGTGIVKRKHLECTGTRVYKIVCTVSVPVPSLTDVASTNQKSPSKSGRAQESVTSLDNCAPGI
jgi:hypothetical protein